MRKPKQHNKPVNDLSRSPTPFDPNHTLIAVVELSKESWLVAGVIPGVERQPLKKLEPSQRASQKPSRPVSENELLKLFGRWRTEAQKAGHEITRIAA
jgi:transposase